MTSWEKGDLFGSSTIPEIGYTTYFIGHYLSNYGKDNCGGPNYVPTGWDHWNALLSGPVWVFENYSWAYL